MSVGKPLGAEAVAALLEFAGLSISMERAQELASSSRDLFADADQVNAFMAPRRDAGIGVKFSHSQDRIEG
jgi:hypothetical protein